MEYTVGELSALSGVTVRTLRWYDNVGLLCPSRIGENGYRYYGDNEVDRLQQILFYRSVDMSLADIANALNGDRLTVLYRQRNVLLEKLEQLEDVVKLLEKTIKLEEENTTMSNEEKFIAFKKELVETNESKFGNEARGLYGNEAVDLANAEIMGMSMEKFDRWQKLDIQIKERLEKEVQSGTEVRNCKDIFDMHKEWLMLCDKSYSSQKHKGVVELYVLDDRFTKYYDSNVVGCACLLRDVVNHFLK